MQLYKNYLVQDHFHSLEDFQQNFKVKAPDNFNFAYDVVDEYARLEPQKTALVWINDEGDHHTFSYLDLKEKSEATVSYFQSLGIQRGEDRKSTRLNSSH